MERFTKLLVLLAFLNPVLAPSPDTYKWAAYMAYNIGIFCMTPPDFSYAFYTYHSVLGAVPWSSLNLTNLGMDFGLGARG